MVLSADLDRGRAWLSLAATEHPELWAFLAGLRAGERLSGAVAAIERFGVFVDLDDGPRHPVHPGVGFITVPELAFARGHRAGDVLDGTVTKVVPFGVFVRVADGVEGLLRDVKGEDVQVGEPIGVVVGEIDVERRRVAFSDRA
ncbi:S1 RNA-binding domain-containing protein [Actinomadura nitritigenes]|uniref:S1 RNA-binding domain-containing protein n=1 Tax=Actinomadura nitritigenes TaxID=134602 RepID=UPI003D923D1A